MSAKDFLIQLQNSDSNRKLRWLIGLTAATTAIIIGVWALTASLTSPAANGLVRKDDQPTFFGKIALSAEHVIDILRLKTANTIHFFSEKFGTTNTVEVEVTDNS